ncbi:hypothetical protein D9M68_828790 [compost metagenome]
MIMPICRASAAGRRAPVKISSLALRMPITQGWISTSRLAVPIEWATGSEKKALSAQTMRSHILATM